MDVSYFKHGHWTHVTGSVPNIRAMLADVQPMKYQVYFEGELLDNDSSLGEFIRTAIRNRRLMNEYDTDMNKIILSYAPDYDDGFVYVSINTTANYIDSFPDSADYDEAKHIIEQAIKVYNYA